MLNIFSTSLLLNDHIDLTDGRLQEKAERQNIVPLSLKNFLLVFYVQCDNPENNGKRV